MTDVSTTHHPIDTTESTDRMVLSAEKAAHVLAATPWRRFAVVGDSIAEGNGDTRDGYADLGWADRLAGWLRAAHPDVTYLNTGRTNATIEQVRDNQLPKIQAFHPDLVHVSCGSNDLWLAGADLDTIEHRLDTLLTEVRADGAQLSLFTLADAFTGRLAPLRDQFAAFNDLVRTLAARHDAILVDLWEHPARLRPDWLSADRVHLTTAGHAVVATELAKAYGRFDPDH
ncbi:SGNH/GDSL hydrolase family protein [Hoyosella sp. YIM 151337]|uniref:SGNH/GDSL hydrolase family protein n=1 Tax=Hoyosella sp. YIM 151337 TaxID=2992742 RepID=UPI0022360DD1|nr:SGNH/GDSL hydrolase family protein [Hoyosella sp. YIM 151337]MCW4353982.1 SGNH/GDSL hydrolase family protein [Hoyosella sp. YIM 151337]